MNVCDYCNKPAEFYLSINATDVFMCSYHAIITKEEQEKLKKELDGK